jgi:transcriptional regulator with XRE-family HTH domain
MKILDMDDDKENLSFGRYLQAIRLEKKISLEQVAEQTRIGLGNLRLVEQEDHEQLPAEVFVKGFLRSYAAAVGADGDEAVRRYESRLDVVQKIAESQASDDQSRTRPSRRKLIIAVGLLLGIIGGAVLAILFLRPAPDTQEPLLSPPPAVQDKPAAAESQGAVGFSAEPEKTIPEKLSLQITAQENTWIKVIVDEQESTEYSLNPGEELELEATTGYNLLIGNAGGIKITLNGKPVAIAGESGQVVTIHLP